MGNIMTHTSLRERGSRGAMQHRFSAGPNCGAAASSAQVLQSSDCHPKQKVQPHCTSVLWITCYWSKFVL